MLLICLARTELTLKKVDNSVGQTELIPLFSTILTKYFYKRTELIPKSIRHFF